MRLMMNASRLHPWLGAAALVLFFSSCSREEEVLNNVQINQIRLDHFSEVTGEGENWDIFTTYPDIFVKIYRGTQLVYTSPSYDECQNQNIYTYDQGLPVYLNFPNETYSVAIYDYDSTSEDEFMGGFEFKPADHEGEEIIRLFSLTSEIEFSLFVDWNYVQE